MTAPQSFQFQSNVSKLLHTIVHSVYSEKDIFLRELISNASDALEKMRLMSLTNKDLLKEEHNFFVRIIPNKEAKTLTIWDSGVGMSKEDMVKYLGTLAESHTQEFKKNSTDFNTSDIIGNFGLGFYSSFLVAKYVEVYSKKYDGDRVHKWTSDASNNFTIEDVNDDTIKRGTKIVLHLNDGMDEYATENKLKEIIKKHSSFTKYPIELSVTKTKTVEEEVQEEKEEEKEDKEGQVEEVDETKKEEKKKEKKHEKKQVTYTEFEKQNNQSPIWKRDPKEVTEEEYKSFYKTLAGGYGDYLTYVHFKTEGTHEFSCLVFIPERAPFDMFREKREDVDISLYVKRVFVSKQCKEIIPEYLGFLKGVVDSEDIPLNISREILQEKNKYIRTINEQVTKHVVEKLTTLGPEVYEKFYENFNKNIKLGVHSDEKHRNKLASLLRFFTLNHQDKQISLSDYVKEMSENQKAIYYITGAKKSDLVNSPFTESLKSKGFDTVLMFEPLDEYVTQILPKYEDKDLCNITKDDLKLDDVKDESDHKEFFEYTKKLLGNKVNKVVASKLLVGDGAPCVVSCEGMSANMERLMMAQTLQDNAMLQYMKGRKTFELNMSHNLVKCLEEQVKNKTNDKHTDNMLNVLFETAMMASGYQLDNVQNFSKRIFNLLEMKMQLKDLVEIQEENTGMDQFMDAEEDHNENIGEDEDPALAKENYEDDSGEDEDLTLAENKTEVSDVAENKTEVSEVAENKTEVSQ